MSWERGRGTDLCAIVHLALQILHRLLSASTAAVLRGPVGGAIRAPPSGPTPHLLLTLAHYAYFFHSSALAIAAVRLLASIAGLTSSSPNEVTAAATAPPLVSVLACLSAAAPAVKELLVGRLESPLEDIRVKVAILELVAACVDQQPGLTQLLLDIQPAAAAAAGEANIAGKLLLQFDYHWPNSTVYTVQWPNSTGVHCTVAQQYRCTLYNGPIVQVYTVH